MFLGDITAKNVSLVKLFHEHVFPVEYPESFYSNLVATPALVKLGYLADCLVGVIGCKVNEEKVLYIMTIGVLKHYRELGIASELLAWAETTARTMHLKSIGLHVHVSNQHAVDFYTNRGFRIAHTEPEYYPQLTPTGAHYMEKELD